MGYRGGGRKFSTPANSIILRRKGKVYYYDWKSGKGKRIEQDGYIYVVVYARTDRKIEYHYNSIEPDVSKNIFNKEVLLNTSYYPDYYTYNTGQKLLEQGSNFKIDMLGDESKYRKTDIKNIKIKACNGDDVEHFILRSPNNGGTITSIRFLSEEEIQRSYPDIKTVDGMIEKDKNCITRTDYEKSDNKWLNMQKVYNTPRKYFIERVLHEEEAIEESTLSVLEVVDVEIGQYGDKKAHIDCKGNSYKAKDNVAGNKELKLSNVNGILDLSGFRGDKVEVFNSKILKVKISKKGLSSIKFIKCDFKGVKGQLGNLHTLPRLSFEECTNMDNMEVKNKLYMYIEGKNDKKINKIVCRELNITGNLEAKCIETNEIDAGEHDTPTKLKIEYIKCEKKYLYWLLMIK